MERTTHPFTISHLKSGKGCSQLVWPPSFPPWTCTLSRPCTSFSTLSISSSPTRRSTASTLSRKLASAELSCKTQKCSLLPATSGHTRRLNFPTSTTSSSQRPSAKPSPVSLCWLRSPECSIPATDPGLLTAATKSTSEGTFWPLVVVCG